ncbi:MAG: S8 family serine peptidase [Thermoplasmata archaeon]
MVALYIGSSAFVRPLTPVIVLAAPGRLPEVSASIRSRDLTRVLSFGPLKGVRPWAAAALSAARQIPSFNMHAAVLDATTITQLAQDPNVAAIYGDPLVRISQFPAVPPAGPWGVRVAGSSASQPTADLCFTSTAWTRKLLGADAANAAGFSGQGTKACVVDTGGHAHPQTRRAAFLTAIPGGQVDIVSHGQWCLSALGGTPYRDAAFSNEVGAEVVCEGMAPMCGLLAVKALDFVIGTAPSSILLAALEIALGQDPDVVSLSWGSPVAGASPQADPFYPAMEALDAAGVLVFAAAGNAGPGSGTLDSPGALPQPVTVGATNVVSNGFNNMFGTAGTVANFSSRGPTPWGDTKPDCVGPGAIIDSGVSPFSQMAVSYTQRPHAAQAIAGTSMATPQIAGLFVLARQAWKQLLGKVLTNTEVKAMLAAYGQPKNSTSGWGFPTWQGTIVPWLSTQYGVTLPGGT